MIATIILAIVIFSGVGYIIYTRFIKRNHAAGCHDCDDLGCPLVDPVKLKQQAHLKK
ncbi:FeoB-associated Cys-rich membrane protein [Liquorilactobacillus sicerae]|uniref:FeoB-associated Cys-rich membrane protein n=1 Tax=Liquorilactobacillus sicerae TaxID=1416943 RepID=UPI002480D3FC|nr:FeoB-associated Cys-rich membrane protein [Liquorilactobacillus sicerae]